MTQGTDYVRYWQRNLAASLIALVAACPPIALAATPAGGRYNCVLMGQGACSEDDCLGNRISPNDRNIKLFVDFGAKTASLNGIPGRLINEAGSTFIRWELAMIGDTRVDIDSTHRGSILGLGPARGAGATAAFLCRKRT